MWSAEHRKESCKVLCIGVTSVTLLLLALILTLSIVGDTSYDGYDEGVEPGPIYYPVDDESEAIPYEVTNVETNQFFIHFVPHSHQDASWLDDVEGYYTHSVKKIFDTVTSALEQNSQRMFTVADIMFFKKWYDNQSPSIRKQWQTFVKEGQVDFVNGGWVSGDEALPSYDQMIENMHMGHAFLQSQFNYSPSLAWEIDAFGHSSMAAKIYSQMGFKGIFYQRQDYRDKNAKKSSADMEFLWQPEFEDESSHNETMFAHIFYWAYTALDFIRLQNPFNKLRYRESDVPGLTNKLITFLDQMQKSYKTHHLLIPMGDDFSYNDAVPQYEFLEWLIKEMNLRKPNSQTGCNYTILFSSPYKYYSSVMSEIKGREIELMVDRRDFLPLINDRIQTWNGYYTSRPLFKQFIKTFKNIATTSSTLYSQVMMSMLQDHQEVDSSWQEQLQKQTDYMLQTSSLMIHHDTITATSQSKIIRKDEGYLQSALDANEQVLAEVLLDMLFVKIWDSEGQNLDIKDLHACYLDLQMQDYYKGQCKFESLSEHTVMVVYNPALVEARLPALQFSMPYIDVAEWDFEEGHFVKSIAEAIETREGQNPVRYQVFVDSVIQPESLAVYLFRKCEDEHSIAITPKIVTNSATIQNDQVQLSIQSFSLGLATFLYEDLQTGLKQEFEFEFRFYETAGSGVYTWKTTKKDSTSFEHEIEWVNVYHGDVVQQISISYKPTKDSIPHSARINLYSNGALRNQVEFDVFVAQIDTMGTGRELTVNWKANNFVKEQNTFYTDANELLVLKRVVNTSDTIPLMFFPVNSFIMIEEEVRGTQMMVMNSINEAGSAFKDSRIELIANRRTNSDDNLGVAEALKEQVSFKTKYFLQFTSKDKSAAFNGARKRQVLNTHPPFTYYSTNFKNYALIMDPKPKLGMYMGIEDIENVFIYPKPSMDSFVVRVTLSKEGVHLNADELAYKVLTDAFEEQSFQHGDMEFDFTGQVKVEQLAMDEVRTLDEHIDNNFLQRQDCIVQAFEVTLIKNEQEKFLA